MSVSRQELRIAVGRTLRHMRARRRLSLDDIEQLTDESGVRVTRSHLSRVETGHADIAVPRLLCLLRALGEPPERAVRALDALLDPCDLPPTLLLSRARAALRAADAPGAVRMLRAALAPTGGAAPEPLLVAWAIGEASLGCWPTAERALIDALAGGGDEERDALRLAVACLGSGRTTLATLLVRAVRAGGDERALVLAAALLAAGRPDQAALAAGDPAGPHDDLRLVLLAACYAAGGRCRSARRAAERAARETSDPLTVAEAAIVEARALGRSRRPTPGLRRLEHARRIAREAGLPFLLARIHDTATRLWVAAGDRGAARAARRAARAIRRRHGAVEDAAPDVPLLLLLARLAPLGLQPASSEPGSDVPTVALTMSGSGEV